MIGILCKESWDMMNKAFVYSIKKNVKRVTRNIVIRVGLFGIPRIRSNEIVWRCKLYGTKKCCAV